MKKLLIVAVVACFALSNVSPVFAFKQLKDAFTAQYAGDTADEGFKKLVTEANCYLCHVKKEKSKKIRNGFGKALHEALEKEAFPVTEFKKTPEKFADRIKDIFKKIEGQKSGDEEHETFGARIKVNLLPGGNIEGEME